MERGHATPLRPALWVTEGAEAALPTALPPPGAAAQPLGRPGEAAPRHSSPALRLAGTHRSMAGTTCCADGSAWPPAWVSSSGSGSGSGSASESPLLELPSPLLELLSPLLELH